MLEGMFLKDFYALLPEWWSDILDQKIVMYRSYNWFFYAWVDYRNEIVTKQVKEWPNPFRYFELWGAEKGCYTMEKGESYEKN